MGLFLISLLVGLWVLLIFGIAEDLVLGDRGRVNNITMLFGLLRGKEKEKGSKARRTFKSMENLWSKYILVTVFASVLICFISLLAFKSLGLALVLSLFGLMIPRVMHLNRIMKRKELINLQLRDALNSITASLKVGLSINSALLKCTDELEKIYASMKDKPILEEFKKIRNDLHMGMSVDEALRGFKERVRTEEADDFVSSIIIVRQKGGNLVEIMGYVSGMITDKINIKGEIARLTAGKKMEAKVLTFIPILIVISLSILSPYYMKPLYSSVGGKILILIGFILLVLNYYIGRKIVDIQV